MNGLRANSEVKLQLSIVLGNQWTYCIEIDLLISNQSSVNSVQKGKKQDWKPFSPKMPGKGDWAQNKADLLHLQCNCNATAVQLQMQWNCNCNATAMQMQCKCNANAMQMQCNANAMQMQCNCKCNANAMRLQCDCNATAMQLQCNCNATAMQLQCNCNVTVKKSNLYTSRNNFRFEMWLTDWQTESKTGS